MKRPWRAQAIIEFALIGLMFFTMMFGVIEGGRLVFAYHEVSNAAKEGARYAVAHGSMSDTPVSDAAAVQAYVRQEVNGLSKDSLQVTAAWPGDPNQPATCPVGANNPGCPVVVSVTYQFQPVVGMIFGISPITLRSGSEMLIHY